MPTTIAEAFQTLKSNLEITGLQDQTCSIRQAEVRRVVDDGLTVYEDFLVGSYRRSTMITPLADADLDIFCVLHHSYYALGQRGLLDKLWGVLRRTYTRTSDISKNGQAVTMKFSDFSVDVVPAFNRSGGGFLIPDSKSARWISTDPRTHIDLWSQSNAAHAGDFIPVVKMMKAWKRHVDLPMSSFHLETIIYHSLNNVQITDFPSAVRFALDKGYQRINNPVDDPAGYSNDVGASMSSADRLSCSVGFTLGHRLAKEAEVHAQNGRTREAFAKWRALFGDVFPAYG